MTKEYAMAYTEIIEILKYIPIEEVKKIPKEKIDFYKTNMSTEYDYKLDITKKIEEQKMSDITKAVLANLFRDYWATPEKRKLIESKERQELQKIEEEKRKKYNVDNIFNNKKDEKVEEKKNYLVGEKKQTFFYKLIRYIKGLFVK